MHVSYITDLKVILANPMNIESICYAGLIIGVRPANEKRRYFVTTSLIGWAQA